MKVITLVQAKTFLGISNTSSDAAITAMIPIIDAKVKQICKNNFDKQILCKTVTGSKTVELYLTEYRSNPNRWPTPELKELMKDLPVGTQISGNGIPAESYIDEIEYSGIAHGSVYVPSFDLNAEATVSDDSAYLKAGINIAYLPVIAKGIQFLINGQTTSITDTSWKSKSFGPVSVSKGDDARLDNVSGMPIWFVKALPRYM